MPALSVSRTRGSISPNVGAVVLTVTRSAGEIPIWVSSSRAAAPVSALAVGVFIGAP
ncbi:hypothetical protein OG563_38420 [Nocardia vinacea]|uniref:Uncharacterized protein n=1 Tax=Nocardia vinacea TaxID=96468 RepID=A0ABZ1YRP4_9NOCA|nr:hypothetical protein [Nocardia vinacea]